MLSRVMRLMPSGGGRAACQAAWAGGAGFSVGRLGLDFCCGFQRQRSSLLWYSSSPQCDHWQ